MSRKPHNYIELDEQEIIDKYEKGMSSRDIAKELGVSKGVILSRLNKNEVTMRTRITEEDLDVDYIKELYETKRLSSREIASRYNCHNQFIINVLKRNGVQVRKSSSDYTKEEREKKYGMKGSDHPNWRGGMTEVNGLIRNAIAYVSLECFKRDGFKCVECGGGEHELHSHHIKSFSEIVSEIREENGLHDDLSTWDEKQRLVEMCAKDRRLLDVDNLLTYCADCHVEEHRRLKEISEVSL